MYFGGILLQWEKLISTQNVGLEIVLIITQAPHRNHHGYTSLS